MHNASSTNGCGKEVHENYNSENDSDSGGSANDVSDADLFLDEKHVDTQHANNNAKPSIFAANEQKNTLKLTTDTLDW